MPIIVAVVKEVPKVAQDQGLGVALTFASNDDRNAFLEALRKAGLSDAEFRKEYAVAHNCDPLTGASLGSEVLVETAE